MANAKRCDKCGGFYIVNAIHQKLAVSVREEGQVWEKLDLCDTCYKELRDFFARRRRKRNKNKEKNNG